MTREQKLEVLRRLYSQITHHGVHTWEETENGYRWTCTDDIAARRLAKVLEAQIELLGLDPDDFVSRFEPNDALIIEPVAD